MNLQTDYALRLLMHLAVNKNALCTIAEVAAHYQISNNHLMKVANTLTRNNIVGSVRGRAGGLRLARPAGELIIGDIVRMTEADFALVECFQGGRNECRITPACRLKSVFDEALTAYLSVLDRYTIANLVNRNPALRTLLSTKAA